MLSSIMLMAALSAAQTQRMPAAAIEERARLALVRRLEAAGSRAEVRLLQPLQEQTLPAGRVELADGDIAGRLPRAEVAVPVRLQVDGRPIRTLTVRFALRDERSVLSYAEAYAARSTGDAVRVQTARVDMTCCAGEPVADAQQLAGLRLKRGVRAGQPVLAGDFEALPDVQAQRPVAIEAAFGQVRLTAPGTALGDGRIGEKVAVRAESSGEIVQARVVAKQKVAVHE